MKIQVTFKTPDAVDYAVINALENEPNADSVEDIKDIISNWVKYDEYVTIEFDTENFTATVCRA